EAVYCPICRHESEATKWNTPAQQAYFAAAAHSHLQKAVNNALLESSNRFNARWRRGGLIDISLSYRPGSPIIAVPPDAADRLRQHFVCESCLCRYSSLGAAFFCPACGHNSVSSTFYKSVDAVRISVEILDAIKHVVRTERDDDAAANTVRHLLEHD